MYKACEKRWPVVGFVASESMKTLVSLWIMVTAALLLSIGGSLWIGGENNVLAVVLLTGAFALFIAGLLGFSREGQRASQDVTHPAWWFHKVANVLSRLIGVCTIMYLLLRDFRIVFSFFCVSLVIGCLLIFLEWKRLAKASPQQ